MQFKIVKKGVSVPIFTGKAEVAQACFAALFSTFYFTAGTAQPRTDEFPYFIEPA